MPVCQWKEEQLHRMRTPRTFDGLGEVVVSIVREMAEDADGKLHQVCGPISSGGLGSMEDNLRVFQTSINVVSQRYQCHVFNQLPLQDKLVELYLAWRAEYPKEEYCWDILEKVYGPIFRSDCIEVGHFIPRWHTSTGTRWERETLQELDILMKEIPEEWILYRVE